MPEDVATRVMITDKLVQPTMTKEAAYNPIGEGLITFANTILQYCLIVWF